MGAAGIGAGAGGLMGLINYNQKKAEYNRQKELAASMESRSPWTGIHGEMPQNDPNMFNSVIQGATSGASFGQGLGGGGASAMKASAPGPMEGASQVGGDSSSMTPMGNEMNGGMSQMAGAYDKPTLYGKRSPWTMVG